MVDEPREVAAFGSIDDGVQVYPEQVRATNAGRLIMRLSHVGHDWTDHLAHILDHHLVCCYRLLNHIQCLEMLKCKGLLERKYQSHLRILYLINEYITK